MSSHSKNPLITVGVITYNSSQYILDCLNSIREQNYLNIELIVSDDFSTDDTVEIIKNWLHINKNRFVNAKLITSYKNKGVSANTNKVCKLANGKWIKPLAGDDLLTPESIEQYVDFVENNDCNIVYSKVKKLNNKIISKESFPKETKFFELNGKQQYNALISGMSFYSPTEFISISLLKKYNYFDPKYRNIEDFPFLLKITRDNNKIFFINKVLLIYRISDTSLSNNYNRKNDYINLKFNTDIQKVYQDLVFPEINKKNILHIIDKKIQFLRANLTVVFGNTYKAYSIFGILNIFNPNYYLYKLRFKTIN